MSKFQNSSKRIYPFAIASIAISSALLGLGCSQRVNRHGIGELLSQIDTTAKSFSLISATPGDAEVTVNWESLPGALSYDVYYKVISVPMGTTLDSSQPAGAFKRAAAGVSGLERKITGLVNRVTYEFYTVGLLADGTTIQSKNSLQATPKSPICDPFTDAKPGSKKLGLKGKVIYWNGDATYESTKSGLDFYKDGAPGTATLPGDLFLNQVNVTTREFSDGFSAQDGGDALKDASGNRLIEWFGIDVVSRIVIPTAMQGDYQFALIADDGAELLIGPNEEKLVGVGWGPNKFACSTKSIPLQSSFEKGLKVRVRYNQGPRYRISLQLLWRKVNATNASTLLDPECLNPSPITTTYGDIELYNNGVEQPRMSQLLSRGWSVVQSQYFFLDQGENPCVE